MGRKPKASEIKRRNGSFKKDPQRENKSEPKGTPGRPPLPTTLRGDRVAKQAWEDACAILEDLNIMTTADRYAVELFCLTYSDFVKARKTLKRDKSLEKAERHPIAFEYNKTADRLMRLMAQMGLDQSSRTRLSAAVGKPDDPLSAWLEKHSKN